MGKWGRDLSLPVGIVGEVESDRLAGRDRHFVRDDILAVVALGRLRQVFRFAHRERIRERRSGGWVFAPRFEVGWYISQMS